MDLIPGVLQHQVVLPSRGPAGVWCRSGGARASPICNGLCRQAMANTQPAKGRSNSQARACLDGEPKVAADEHYRLICSRVRSTQDKAREVAWMVSRRSPPVSTRSISGSTPPAAAALPSAAGAKVIALACSLQHLVAAHMAQSLFDSVCVAGRQTIRLVAPPC